MLSTHLGIIFHFSIDNREPDFAGGRPAMASETCGSPQAKRCKREEQELQFLLVKSKDGQRCPFVDLGKKTQKWWTHRCPFFTMCYLQILGVYTKNRNFRLYKSSKAGKRTTFTVARDNAFHAKPEKSISAEESVFLASLICNVRYVHTSVQFFCSVLLSIWTVCILSFTGQRILTWDGPEAKEAKTSRPPCQQGSDTNQGDLYLSICHCNF